MNTSKIVALARQNLPYAWTPVLIDRAEKGDKKATAELRKWLRLIDVLPGRKQQPSDSEYYAERRAEQAAEDWIGGFCE